MPLYLLHRISPVDPPSPSLACTIKASLIQTNLYQIDVSVIAATNMTRVAAKVRE